LPGLYFDELTVGQVFQHPIRRTITETDNVWFSAITHNRRSSISTRNIAGRRRSTGNGSSTAASRSA
jgi:hypothetical protein